MKLALSVAASCLATLLLTIVILVAGGHSLSPHGAPCANLSGGEVESLSVYVGKQFNMNHPVAFTTSKTAPGSCMMKLTFASGSAGPLQLYLSADHRYLIRDIYDTTVDPEVEQENQRQKIKTELDADSSPQLGKADAPVSLVVFSDLQCPYCRSFERTIHEAILPREGARVRLVFKNLPLPIHDWAREAAMQAACVAQQNNDAFWSFQDFIFERQLAIKSGNLSRIADQYARKDARIDYSEYSACVKGSASRDIVDRDMGLARKLGVRVTPTTFLNGKMIEGAIPARSLLREIQSAANTSSR